jgi:serine phosphatase RsbU (regulator of sigma subunit)
MAGGVLEEINADNRRIPLGVLSNEEMLEHDSSYANKTIQLKKGSKLIVYSDGLTEAISSVDLMADFESCVLAGTFLKNASLPADAFVSRVYSSLVEFHGRDSFDDDVCLICLDVL